VRRASSSPESRAISAPARTALLHAAMEKPRASKRAAIATSAATEKAARSQEESTVRPV
jgi:hypothetical protein